MNSTPTRAPTLEDVAAHAGVSRATASRVVNEDPRVGGPARDAVLGAVSALGYRPNRAARSLVTRAPDSVAVVVPESDDRVFSDPFFSRTLAGVTRALADSPLQVVLVMGGPGGDTGRMARYLRGGHTDGAIVVSHHRHDRIWEVLAETRLPSVYVGRPFSLDVPLPFVDVDNVDGGRRAAQHLLDRGCSRIGMVGGPLDMSSGQDRLTGWRRALEAAGRDVDLVEAGDFTPAGGADAMRRLLERQPGLDGVFVASDLMAVAALREAAAAGRAVPGDLAVVGFDDIDAAASTQPALTTVRNPVAEMAGGAVHLLQELMAGRPVESEVLPAELVVRESA